MALALIVSMAATALHDVSRAFDVWYYHMPFAARLLGIVSPAEFVFHSANEARYCGYPLLGELLQGLLWRLTGLPTAANLVAFCSVPAVAVFLRIHFGVPMHTTALALLAIPLVQIHATSCYVDLPANCAAAVLVLVTLDAYVRRQCLPKSLLLLAFAAAAVAANMKTLLHPVVMVSLVLLVLRYLATQTDSRRFQALSAMLVLLPIVFITPLKNVMVHQNPYYPVQFSIAGHVFPGTEEPYVSSPTWLRDTARPLRFAASVLEIGTQPMTERHRWSIDQWTPTNDRGYRLGGFFGAYVIVQLILLVLASARDRSRFAIVSTIGFAALTVLTAIMPQSHELRYYIVWMIVLVSINLWRAARQGQVANLRMDLLSCLALAMVLHVTHAIYVYPCGVTFSELLHDETDEHQLAKSPGHAPVCVSREPFNILWAAPFHPPLHYVTTEAEHDADCAGGISIR